MTPEEKLQGLLRLKKHETPPEGYFDDFLDAFHQRQRKELMNRGSMSLLWERVTTSFETLSRPAVIWGACAAYGAIMLLVIMWPKPGPTPRAPMAIIVPAQSEDVNQAPAVPTPPRARGEIPVGSRAPVLEPSGTRKRNLDEEQPAPKTREL